MRVVLDSNVLVAAFATQGLCHLVYEAALAHHEILISSTILIEVEKALRSKLKFPKSEVEEILRFIKAHSVHIKNIPIPDVDCRDPDDKRIIGLALQGRATVLVTGDNDLLVIEKTGNISILSPRAFWEVLRK